jgi:hypothetical protein
VGWRERDWARATEADLRPKNKTMSSPGKLGARGTVALAANGFPSPQRRRRVVAWALAVAAAGAAAVVLLGQLPRDDPVLPGLQIDLPGDVSSARKPGARISVEAPRTSRLEGPKVARRGGRLTISGQAPPGVEGPVRIEGHWNARPWDLLAADQLSSNGTYEATITLQRAGMLNLRVYLPNGDVVTGAVRVVR